MLLKVLLLSISSFIVFKGLQAQSDSLDYYFDDNGISSSKNVIKLSPSGLLSGDYGLSYERVIDDILSIELGLFLWTDGIAFGPWLDYSPNIPSSSQTLSFTVACRFYIESLNTTYAPGGLYGSFAYRQRKVDYSSESQLSLEQSLSHQVIVYVGYQWLLGKRLCLDIYGGNGVAYTEQSYRPGQTPPVEPGLRMRYVPHLGFKLGWRF